MATTDDLRYVLSLVHAQIAAADGKATALLTIAGVLIAFPAPAILVGNSAVDAPFAASFLAAAAGIAFIISVCAALAVLFPRTTNRTDTSSLIYFRDIAALEQAQYAQVVASAHDDRWRGDLIAQIHVNAAIARKKHGSFKVAVVTLIVGIALLSAAYVLLAIGSRSVDNAASVSTTQGA